MLVSDAEKNPEDKMRKTSMPNSTLIGMSLKTNEPFVAIGTLLLLQGSADVNYLLAISYNVCVINFI